MEINSIIERFKPHAVPIIVGFVGLIFLIIGLVSFIPQQKEHTGIVFEAASTKQTTSEAEKQLTVDIEGGVVKPGVYSLPDGARIQDGVLAAGGFSEQANIEAVAKILNLAAKLTDGAKVYIPLRGDASTISPLRQDFVGQAGQGVTGSNVININAASIKELDSLPGIGEVTAQKIINGRPFSAVDELLTKKIVSKKVFDEIKDKISVF